MRKHMFFAILITISSHASANVYTWHNVSSQSGTSSLGTAFHGIVFDSAPSACQYTFDNYPIKDFTDPRTVYVSAGRFNCVITRGTSNITATYAQRFGTTCLPEYTYDPSKGVCIPPEPPDQSDCEKRAGEEISFNRSGKAPDAFLVLVGTHYANSTLACNAGCQISVPEPKCVVRVTGEYTCAGNATVMPIECPVEGGGDGFVEEAAPDVFTPPEPQVEQEETPCLYTMKPDGTWSCKSSETIEAEGVTCGTANGQVVCNTTQPTKQQTTIDTTVSTTTNPDGSSETTKTDQSTYVTCVGAKCDSSKSTTTTNTNKGPNGNIINSSSSCTGPNCMGNSSEGAGDGSDGPGGTGQCLVNCSEGEDGGGEFTGGEFGEVATIGDATGEFMERVSDAPIMQAVAGISLRGGGSCSFPSVNTDIGVIGLDFMCQNSNWLDPLYYVFLAIWGLAAVRVFMSA